MTLHQLLLWLLLAPAALLVLVCAVGLAVMRDPFQRLHYTVPPASIAASLFVAAAIVDDPGWLTGAKRVALVALLVLTNGVVTHAIARAALVRELGRWQVKSQAEPAPGPQPEPSGESPRPSA